MNAIETIRWYGWRHAPRIWREKLLIKLAFLLPKSLVYWAFIRFDK